MSKGILGPTVVTLCLGCIGGFHCLKSMRRSSYDDASKNVGELLEKEKFTLISFEEWQNENEWTKIIEAYNKADPKEIFAGTKQKDPNLKEQLKSECKQVIEKTTNSIDAYSKARSWCVIPQTVTERLSLHGKEALSLVGEKDNEELIAIAEQNQKNGIDGFEIKGKKDKELAKAMQVGCKPLLEAQNWDKDFDSKFNKSKKVCSRNKQ